MLGAPVVRMRSWPQAHAAVRAGVSAMPAACHRLVSQARRRVADTRPVFIPRGARTLARRSKLRVGPTIAVGALTLLLCVGIGLLFIGWQPGSSLNLTGYIAMALGL